MNKLILSIFLILLIFSPSIVNSNTVKLVTGNDYAPFTDETLPNGGFATEIVTAVFTDMGEQVIYDWLPWKRGYREASNGSYLGTFPYIPSEERKMDFLYSQPLLYASERLISIKSESPVISTWDDIDGSTICLPLGYATVKKMTDRIKSGKVLRITKTIMSDCFRSVQGVKSYYALSSIIQAWFTAKDLGADFNELSISKLDISDKKHSGLSLIISRKIEGGADWIKRFNKSLSKLKENGTVDKIILKHLGDDFPTELLN